MAALVNSIQWAVASEDLGLSRVLALVRKGARVLTVRDNEVSRGVHQDRMNEAESKSPIRQTS